MSVVFWAPSALFKSLGSIQQYLFRSDYGNRIDNAGAEVMGKGYASELHKTGGFKRTGQPITARTPYRNLCAYTERSGKRNHLERLNNHTGLKTSMRHVRPFELLVTRAVPIALISAMVLAVGCSSSSKHTVPAQPHYDSKAVIDEAAPPGTYANVERQTADSLASALASQIPQRPRSEQPETSKPLNILVLSGAGQYAAYAGGILVGWTAKGTRPEFDIVTGVSSGAMTAVYAYLGPKYDHRIQHMAMSIKTSDIYNFRPVTGLLFHQSLASFKPLAKLVEQEITDECLADIRAAHASGRRLFVGTTNQRTRRLVIWDLGAIASCGRPDANALVKKILVATSSIPGLAPSINFDVEVNGVHYREEHVDGGALSQVFLRFGPEVPRFDPAKPNAQRLAGCNLYAIAGGKLYADTVEGRMGMLKRTTSVVSGTLYALYRADLWRIYTVCISSGMKFSHTANPAETPVNSPSTVFDHDTMRELYNLGYDSALHGNPWRQTPPGYEAGEEDYPRAGLRFDVP
jgi:hypothetical protein